ncbi:MAG: heme ABC transporter ATP-binding protein, partial [Bdellovibrionales bacterium RIFOXYC2_FULL_39_8]
MSEVIVELKNITKRFGSFLANDNLSLSIKKGEIHALLGENGAGKSTLMNILYGLVSPTSGEIFLHGKKVEIKNSLQAISLGIGMVHQHFMLIETFTVTENIVLGRETSRYGLLLDLPQAEHAIQKISAEFGPAVNPRAKISEISVGMQQRVEIIKALYHQAEILILDEPTAVLTPLEIEEFGKIIKRLSSLGKTIIIITHKLKEIKALADRCTIICKGKLVDTVEVAQTSEQELAYKMVGRKVEFKFNKTPPSSQKKILSLQNIVALNKRGLPALQNLSIELYTGEILGIAGIDGNGQSELAEILTGLRAIESGKIEKNGEDITNKSPANLFLKKISSIPEDRQKRGLVLDFSVAENMILQTHHLPPF